jgi:hypothetical protein
MADFDYDSEKTEVASACSDSSSDMEMIDSQTVHEFVYRGVSHTFSMTWHSDIEKESTRLNRLLLALTRLAPESFLFPVVLGQWINHLIATVEAEKKVLIRRIKAAIEERTAIECGRCRIIAPFYGKPFRARQSPVLARSTIWNAWDIPIYKPSAAWPKHQEMKWEGDDRKVTGVGRFLPLPREPGNETVAWHHLRIVPTYELDKVRRLEDQIGKKATEVDCNDGLGRMLLGDLLWNSMDDAI